MRFTTTNAINPKWSGYDKTVARCHLSNYGTIYIDNYKQPIDDEFTVEGIRDAIFAKVLELWDADEWQDQTQHEILESLGYEGKELACLNRDFFNAYCLLDGEEPHGLDF